MTDNSKKSGPGMESSTTPSSSNPSTSSSILSDLTFPLGVLVGGLLAVGIQNGCRPYTLMNTQVCQPIKSFLTHASQQVDSHLVQWGLVDRNRPYYPTADYPELGVQQLYDPTILPLDEFLEEYQASADHIEDFQGRWKYRKASKACVFHDERCLLWRVEGKCFNETSPTNAIDFFEMTTKCCPACDSIDDVKYFTDCPIDPDTYNAFYAPGQVTETFLGMLQRVKAAGFSPIVHAAPDKNAVPAEYIADSDNVDSVKHGPWVVTIDDFVTNQEADALVDHGEKLKFERSMDGIVKEDGTSDLGYVSFRTSHETYCFANTDCVADPIVVNLMERITTALQMPLENCDYLQLLRYKKGQLYKEHQDYHTHQAMGAPGARVVTWYMYLGDVEKGGETQFPRIPFKVTPKKGRVLVWSNILDHSPNEEDLKARHEALPVLEGVKYGATAWFHHRNIREMPDKCRN